MLYSAVIFIQTENKHITDLRQKSYIQHFLQYWGIRRQAMFNVDDTKLNEAY